MTVEDEVEDVWEGYEPAQEEDVQASTVQANDARTLGCFVALRLVCGSARRSDFAAASSTQQVRKRFLAFNTLHSTKRAFILRFQVRNEDILAEWSIRTIQMVWPSGLGRWASVAKLIRQGPPQGFELRRGQLHYIVV
eukprot:3359995-Amphidinium_carterae.2